ncbi:DUF1524 domain-containing protein [Branchiibius hedensis]|uniref:DUF1524 domain-containing protein n=1 Tax=Branchiibius hedensis TaxID=672460 RepID=UPI000D6C40EB|nr:DUF1524 domain-containing protein [Branchiibius hedensis]
MGALVIADRVDDGLSEVGALGELPQGVHLRLLHWLDSLVTTEQSGDIHHIVPKDYLQKNGYPDRADYNQVANFALTETSINISISNKPPSIYMAEVDEQVASGILRLGEIVDAEDLARNLQENAVPLSVREATAGSYPEFLDQRRKLMAGTIRDFYRAL